MVAKNDMAHQSLSSQLQEKSVDRLYYALVHGVIEHNSGKIEAPIGRDPKDRQKMCVTDQNAKEAVTNFRVVERFRHATLVECRLETGRTHQIRVHMQLLVILLWGIRNMAIVVISALLDSICMRRCWDLCIRAHMSTCSLIPSCLQKCLQKWKNYVKKVKNQHAGFFVAKPLSLRYNEIHGKEDHRMGTMKFALRMLKADFQKNLFMVDR